LRPQPPEQNDEYDEDDEEMHAPSVHMVCYENLLVVKVFLAGQISLCGMVKMRPGLADLDIVSVISHGDTLWMKGVKVSKDLLALLCLWEWSLQHRVLFFRLNTSQPAATPPQLIGMEGINYSDIVIHVNEKWVGLWLVDCRDQHGALL
jgi:hypothetical protein